jgi:hypothetical protein
MTWHWVVVYFAEISLPKPEEALKMFFHFTG